MSGGAARGRRRAHPGGAGSGPHGGVEALLAAALRETDDPDAVRDAGELRAVAAFRTARDAGALQAARTRRRDDWRPQAARRHTARSLRTTLSVAVAGLALGGAAYAAIGSATDGDGDAGRPEATATATASEARSAAPSGAPDAPVGRERPANAKDTEAHCRAYENVRGTGKALDSTAWQRLVTAAGGEKNVPAYCAAQGGPKAEKTPNAEKPEKPEKSAKPQKSEATDKAANGATDKATSK
ncbi:hypothetical protein ABZ725_02195 [Streptomyces sp. NPDC006872]|uniref:hypothetical protein n=1 Tax=Streptomyces sp. NPDC006872 TaxID=3155720 RepID=UPI003400D30C